MPELPDEPLEPEVPDEPLEPEVPEEPLLPEVPEEPEEPEVPEAPVSPLSPVRAKVIIISSPALNGLAADESTGLTVISKYPVLSVKLEIVNSTN